MDFANNNPPSNKLGPEITHAMVTDAIKASGYPLQLIVADLLSPNFSLQDEWSYLDSDEQKVRTVDIVATRLFYDHAEFSVRARPSLSFIIECKQSELPYVFFLSRTTPEVPDFPSIAGLKSHEISITTNDSRSSWRVRPLSVLGLEHHSFLTVDAPFCMTFSNALEIKRN